MADIAFLSFYSGVVERGVETFVFEVARRLAKKNKVVVFQAGAIKTKEPKSVQIKAFAQQPKSAKGIPGKFYLDKQSLKILFFTIRSLPKLYRGKYDLIIPVNGGWQTVVVKIFSVVTGAKILVTGHAGIGSDDAANLLLRPDFFVALTSSQATWAKKLVPEVKTTVITNGVDLSRFNPKIDPSQVPLEEPIVICTSALVPYKRVDLTIKAVAKSHDLSLLVLGDGELHGSLDSLGKRTLGKRYLRLVVPYKDIPSYYRAGQVFTLASKTEAFGIGYLEAMACNLPIVTTSDDQRAEIIGAAGILTDTSNVEQYAKDLKLAVKINYKNIPYAQALKFSWNKVGEKYSNLISTLLSQKND